MTDKERIAQAREFTARMRSMSLATVSGDGAPEASYAPFVTDIDGLAYIYVSQLAKHTANLLASRRAAALILADEQSVGEIFARERVSFRCDVDEVPRDSEAWAALLEVFHSRFGHVIEMIRPLTDFHLLSLTAREGVYVRGFAQAHSLDAAELRRILAVPPR